MPQYVFKYVGVDSDGDLGILSRRLPLEQITALRTGERAAAALAGTAAARSSMRVRDADDDGSAAPAAGGGTAPAPSGATAHVAHGAFAARSLHRTPSRPRVGARAAGGPLPTSFASATPSGHVVHTAVSGWQLSQSRGRRSPSPPRRRDAAVAASAPPSPAAASAADGEEEAAGAAPALAPAPAAPAGGALEARAPQELYLRYLRVRQAMATPASARSHGVS